MNSMGKVDATCASSVEKHDTCLKYRFIYLDSLSAGPENIP